MRRIGKSNRAQSRHRWQQEMVEKYRDVTRCEWLGCGRYTEENAHRLKKTKITGETEYIDGRAKLCRHHHQLLDEATGPFPHERMFLAIDDIMRRHGRIIVTPDSQQMSDLIERLEI